MNSNAKFNSTQIQEILQEMGYESNSNLTSLKDLGFDSLSLLEFLMLIEDRTGAEISMEELSKDATLDDIEALIRQRLHS